MAHRFVMSMLALCVVGSAQAAQVIVNEYNAVEDTMILQNGTGDPYLGSNVSFCEDDDGEIELPRKACVDDSDCLGAHVPRCLSGRLQNGGDWFEVVVIQDHLDMRGWDFFVTQGGGVPEEHTLTLTQDLIWSDVRSGTIITVAEDIGNNVDDYQPETGDWWINVRAADGAAGTYISNTDFPTSNDQTQISVRDELNNVIFGPAGEGVNPLSGVGNTEVFKLEADPSSSIIPGSCDPCTPNYWNDGSSSTFGQPNLWSGGAMQQDFSALRSVVPYSPLTSIIINEVNTHTDLPDEDWIELYNTTGSPVDVGGWFLSDNTENLMRYEFPTPTIIPAGGYLVITETELAVFALNGETGEEVYLSEGDGIGGMTGARTWIRFGPVENAVSWGRSPNLSGPLYRMTTRSMGAGNSAPIISDVVINEIMYNPECVQITPECQFTGCCDGTGSIPHDEKEYIELYNPTGSSVDLWRDFGVDGTFGWRITDGIDFEFAVGTTLDPGEFLLVVRFDPVFEPTKLADFKTFYGLSPSLQIVGPYGALANNPGGLNDFNDQLDLRRPDNPSLDPMCNCQVAPMVVWDGVHYYDFGAWPVGADGAGFSLERIDAFAVSQPPTNWDASTTFMGTPGAFNSVPEPGGVLQLVSGGLGLAWLDRRRTRKKTERGDRAQSSMN